MSNYSVTRSLMLQSPRRTLAVAAALLRHWLTALIHEWQSRRAIARVLGHLSDGELRDIGLTRADVEVACAGNFNQPAMEALKRSAQSRPDNW